MTCSRTHELDFDPKDPGSTELFGFDFSDLLKTGETITSATAEVFGPGGDTMLTGQTIITGAVVEQMISGGTHDHKYHLTIWANTSTGQKKPLCADFLVVDPKLKKNR